jgi:hypothetical protein
MAEAESRAVKARSWVRIMRRSNDRAGARSQDCLEKQQGEHRESTPYQAVAPRRGCLIRKKKLSRVGQHDSSPVLPRLGKLDLLACDVRKPFIIY